MYLCVLFLIMAVFFRRYKSTIYGNYRRAYLLYGVAIGVVMGLISLIYNVASTIPLGNPDNYVTNLVMAIGIFGFSYHYRQQLPEKKVTLKELMLLGLGMGVVSSLIFGLWELFDLKVLSPEMVDYYNSQRIATMPTETPEQMSQIAIVKGYTASDWAFISGFRSVVLSILIMFFSALVFRTEKAPVQIKNRQSGEVTLEPAENYGIESWAKKLKKQ